MWATGIERCVAKSARLPVLHAEAFAKKPASVRSTVVEIFMQPHCSLQNHFEHVPRTSLRKQLQLRVLRSARQSRRRKRAGVRRGIPTYRFRWLERPAEKLTATGGAVIL